MGDFCMDIPSRLHSNDISFKDQHGRAFRFFDPRAITVFARPDLKRKRELEDPDEDSFGIDESCLLDHDDDLDWSDDDEGVVGR